MTKTINKTIKLKQTKTRKSIKKPKKYVTTSSGSEDMKINKKGEKHLKAMENFLLCSNTKTSHSSENTYSMENVDVTKINRSSSFTENEGKGFKDPLCLDDSGNGRKSKDDTMNDGDDNEDDSDVDDDDDSDEDDRNDNDEEEDRYDKTLDDTAINNDNNDDDNCDNVPQATDVITNSTIDTEDEMVNNNRSSKSEVPKSIDPLETTGLVGNVTPLKNISNESLTRKTSRNVPSIVSNQQIFSISENNLREIIREEASLLLGCLKEYVDKKINDIKGMHLNEAQESIRTPEFLPFHSIMAFEQFENDDSQQNQMLNYFKYKCKASDMPLLCRQLLKESFNDNVACLCTWKKKENGRTLLSMTNFCKVSWGIIHHHYPETLIDDFSTGMIEGLRAAKQRNRDKTNKKKKNTEATNAANLSDFLNSA